MSSVVSAVDNTDVMAEEMLYHVNKLYLSVLLYHIRMSVYYFVPILWLITIHNFISA